MKLCTPVPMDISAITAPTPMLMPIMVRKARSLLATSVPRASLISLEQAHGMSFSPLHRLLRRHGVEFGSGSPGQATIWSRHRLVAGDLAVGDADDAVGVFGDAQVVRDEDDGDAALRVQPLEQAHDLRAGLRVEVARRLVGQDDGRLGDQRAGDGDALLLAARQLVGVVLQPVAQPDGFQRLAGPLTPLARTHAGVDQRLLDVVDGRRAAQQVERLEDEADFPVANLGQLVVVQLLDVHAVQLVRARRRPGPGSP